MKTIHALLLSAALVLSPVFVPSAAMACGDQACACAQDKDGKEGKNGKTASRTKNGRKMKCSKCAEHGEQKADAKPTETTPAETAPAKS